MFPGPWPHRLFNDRFEWMRAAVPKKSYTVLYRRYRPLVLEVALRRLDNPIDAEDATAEVFAIAWRRFQADEVTLTLPWLYQVLRNVVGDRYRKVDLEASLALELHTPWEAADDAARVMEVFDLHAALRAMPKASRELLYWVYWQEPSYEQVSHVLECTVPAARSRVYRARRELAAILAAQDEGTWASEHLREST